MSSYIGHGRMTVILTVPTAVVVFGVTQDLELAFAAGLGVLTGLIIDPDLDLTQPTGSRIRVEVASSLLGFFWRAFWWPYGRAIRHRSVVSHFPIIGTLGRVFYLLSPIMLVSFVLQSNLILMLFQASGFWLFVIGLGVSDMGHWLADGMPVRI